MPIKINRGIVHWTLHMLREGATLKHKIGETQSKSKNRDIQEVGTRNWTPSAQVVVVPQKWTLRVP